MKKLLKRVTSAVTAAVISVSAFAFGSAANPETDDVSKRLLDGALKFSQKIDITDLAEANGWEMSDLSTVILHAYLYEPELFFMSNELRFAYNGNYFVVPTYVFEKEEYVKAKENFDAAAEKAVAGITDDMTDVEKVLYVHDYLILNCGYDYDRHGYDAYDCLVEKDAVCQGYSLAYEYILRKYLGIECTVVYSDSMVHAWNYVKIGKNWYHVDVTKDDASTTYKNTSYDNYGAVMHENFLLSDSAIRNTADPHYDWKVIGDYPAANDTSYDNAFWRKSDSPVLIDGKTCYYVVNDEEASNEKKRYAAICSYNFDTGVAKKLIRINTKWYMRRSSDGTNTYKYGDYFYMRCWMSLAKRGNKIYFNTNKNVYSYNLKTGKAKKVFTLEKGDDQIFGMMFTDSSKLRLAYRTDVTYPEKYISLKFN